MSERNVDALLGEIFEGQKIEAHKQDRIGGDSVVFDVTVSGKDYILRTGAARGNYDLEHEVMRRLLKKGILVANTVTESVDTSKYPFTFSLQEKLPGEQLTEISKKLWPVILTEAGENLKKLYEIKIDGFGLISPEEFRKTGELKGTENSWHTYFDKLLSQNFAKQIEDKIEKDKQNGFKDSNLTDEEVRKILEITGRVSEIKQRLKQVKPLLDKVDARLIHHDLSGEHFLVNDGKLSGIIDLNYASGGDPLFDIAYFSVMPGGEMFKYLLEASEIEMDDDLFSFYRLVVAAGKIRTRYIRHNYLHENNEILDIAINELNRK